MYYVDDKLLEKLPDDVQKIIMKEGVKSDSENKVEYGDDYEDEVDDEGKITELPEKKKNEITDFDKAGDRGLDLLMALDTKPKTDEQRKMNHKKKFGTTKLPPRGTGLKRIEEDIEE